MTDDASQKDWSDALARIFKNGAGTPKTKIHTASPIYMPPDVSGSMSNSLPDNLMGAPSGYTGGGTSFADALAEAKKNGGSSIILIDEIEKMDPGKLQDILNQGQFFPATHDDPTPFEQDAAIAQQAEVMAQTFEEGLPVDTTAMRPLRFRRGEATSTPASDYAALLGSPAVTALSEKFRELLKDKTWLKEKAWEKSFIEEDFHERSYRAGFPMMRHGSNPYMTQDYPLYEKNIYSKGVEQFEKFKKDTDFEMYFLSPEERALRQAQRGGELAEAFSEGTATPTRPLKPLRLGAPKVTS
jgi:hypothetical protein